MSVYGRVILARRIDLVMRNKAEAAKRARLVPVACRASVAVRIPRAMVALAEMRRVLWPDGRLGGVAVAPE
jgi:hypothetical protein